MENELGRVVDALAGLVWTALPDGHVDFLNRRWREYTGVSSDAACGHGWQEAIHPEDLPGVREVWGSLRDFGESREVEARIRRSDGEYRLFLIRTSRLADDSGHTIKWCGVGIDIEDNRRNYEALYARWWLLPAVRTHHFRSVTADLRGLNVLMTPAGEIENANRHYLEYFGASLEQLRNRTTADIIHPDDLSTVLNAWWEAVETSQPYVVEARYRRADGVYRWFNIRGIPLRDMDERIVFWYLLQTDIDSRKRAQALNAGEKRLLEMITSGESLSATLIQLCLLVEDLCPEPVACSIQLLDQETKKLWHAASPSVPKGYTAAIDGTPIGPDVSSCGRAAYLGKQTISSDIATDPHWEMFRGLALSNGLKACWSTPIISKQNRVLGTLGMFSGTPGKPTADDRAVIDQIAHLASIVIERTRSEDALNRSQAFLAKAQHLSSTGSFSWLAATDEITWSEELYRIFALDPGTLVTLALIGTRLHPEDVPAFEDTVNQARRDGKPFEHEFRLLLPDHSVKHLHVVADGTRNPHGRLEYIGAVQDVTQRRLSEEALNKARAELAHVARVTTLGALTASIAHEVNQPLSGIITNASTCMRMLAADPPNIEGARETARRTIRDGNRASEVITRLRALFSKTGTRTESVDLNEATQEVIALTLSELQRSGVVLRQELAENLPLVPGDRVQLQQVILNLLMNAADAMSGIFHRPRQLVIKTEMGEGDCVRLNVQDTGVGIDPKAAERLFEAFYTTKSGGMGIGLSVSRSIIENHKGQLWAVPNEGPGATFAFFIPRGTQAMTQVTGNS